jgi:hypothetical protein
VEWENIKQNRNKEADEDEVDVSSIEDAEYDPFIKSPNSMEMTPRANGVQKKERHVKSIN